MYKSRKIVLIVPAFCNADLFAASRDFHIDYLTNGIIDECWCLGNKYPLPTVKENDERLKNYCAIYGYNYFDSEFDRGLHDSINNFYKHHDQPPGTIHIAIDSDSRVPSKGFDLAMVKAVVDGGLAMVALRSEPAWSNILNRYNVPSNTFWVDDVEIFKHPMRISGLNVSAYDLDWIKQIGGFGQEGKYYGYWEVWLQTKLFETNKHGGYIINHAETLIDYGVDNDPLYHEYKGYAIANKKGLSFGEWLDRIKGIKVWA